MYFHYTVFDVSGVGYIPVSDLLLAIILLILFNISDNNWNRTRDVLNRYIIPVY
jgi:hypothetical protein